MPKFEDGTGNTLGLGLLPAIWLTIVVIFLVAWSAVVVAIIVVPAALIAAVAAGAVRWLAPRKINQPHRPLVIEGEYEVLNSGTDNGWPR